MKMKNRSRPAFVGLAHELAHAFEADRGTLDTKVWFTFSDGSVATNSEKFASHIENLIRVENNLPLRAYYGIDKGQGKGRLLLPGTRKSAHFGPYIQELKRRLNFQY